MSKKKEVRKQLEELEADPECRKMHLKDLLMLPIQHMMRYTMHLKDMEKAAGESHPDKAGLAQSLNNFAREMAIVNQKKGEQDAKIAEQLKITDAYEELKEFLVDMEGGESLLKAGRTKVAALRCKGTPPVGERLWAAPGAASVKGKVTARQMTLFLMTDCLILCSTDGRSTATGKKVKKVKDRMSALFGKGGKKSYFKEFVFPKLSKIHVNKVPESTFGEFTLSIDDSNESIYQFLQE